MTYPSPLLRSMDHGRSFLSGGVTALLCVTVAFPVDLAAATPHGSSNPAQTKHLAMLLTPHQRAVHALNRLTFGPRPGEVASMEETGLEAWFQGQLHPERIPDDTLALRLAQYPAMQLSQTDLVARFPTPGMLRRYEKDNVALPQDGVEHAIYADGVYRYEQKSEEKQAAKNNGNDINTDKAMFGIQSKSAAAPIVRLKPASGVATSHSGLDGNETAAALKDAVLRLPPDARMQRLVAMSPDQMATLQKSLKGPEEERLVGGMRPEQVEQIAAMRSPERLIDSEVLGTRLLRDVYSQRQLQAVMVDFWLNHFSVYLRKNQNEPYLLPAYERDAILPNALGKFENLLIATARSPAMLTYLDNAESTGPNSKAALRLMSAQQSQQTAAAPKGKIRVPKGINENYARELMELHTLGVKGGYTQADIIEVAKCFTGWTIDKPAEGGEFQFNPNRHEPGSKTVLGQVIPEDGMNEGLAVLHILATSPSTAHFVSQKLAERFVSDAPPPTLVNHMAATFLKSDGDIRAVLTTMFHSPEFWSPNVYRAKVKTPLEFTASTLRATGAEVTNPAPLVQALDRLGMPIYGMPTPNGYSWQADAWVSSNALLTRMNFALVLGGNRLGGTRLNWPGLLGTGVALGAIPDPDTERRLELVLLNQPAAQQTRDAALHMAETPGVQEGAEQSFRAISVHPANTPATPDRPAAGLMMRTNAGRGSGAAGASAPDTPLATVAGLLLGSPDFQRR